MQQETNVQAHRREVIDELLPVDIQQPVSRHLFDDDPSIDKKVDPVKSDLLAVEEDRIGYSRSTRSPRFRSAMSSARLQMLSKKPKPSAL